MALTDDLIAWWDGEDETDSHSGGHDLLEINSPTYVSAKVGNGFQPDRTSGAHWRINNADAGAFDMGTGDYTIAFWLEQVDHAGNQNILEYGNVTGQGISIYSNGNDNIIVYIDDGTTAVGKQFVCGMTGGAFYCVVIEFDRDGNMALYLNDTLIDTASISALSASNIQPTTDLFIGNGLQGRMDNILDSVAIWSRLLGSTDRSAYYNSGAGVAYADIAGGDAHTIPPNDSSVTVSLDETTITQNHVLSPADLSVASSLDAATITQNHILTADDGAVTVTLDQASMVQGQVLVPDSLSVSVSLDETTITQNHVLSPVDTSVTVSLDETTITQVHLLSPADSSVTITLDESSVTPENDTYTLTPNGLSVTTTLDSSSISQVHILSPVDGSVSAIVDTTTITQLHILSPADGAVSVVVDQTLVVLPSTVSTASVSLGAGYTASLSLGEF